MLPILSKCPICSGDAKLKEFSVNYGQGGLGKSWGVECCVCHFHQTKRYDAYSEVSDDKRQEFAIIAWNNRIIDMFL